MFRHLPRLRLWPLAWIALAAACRKEPMPPQWDLDLLAPLATTSLTVADLVPDSLLTSDPAGNVSIRYTSVLFTLELDTLLTAPDTSFGYAYALPVPGPITFPAGTTMETSDEATQFELDQMQLSRLDIRSGTVQLSIANSMPGNIIGDFSLPGTTLGGSPFSIQLTMPPGVPGQPSTSVQDRDLAGYSLDLRGPDLNAVNTLETHLAYSCSPDFGPVSISDQDSLLATVSYQGIVPAYATGYFGNQLIHLDPGSSTLDIFTGLSGSLDVDQVTAALRIRNGIGADLRADIHYLRSVNTASGQQVDLQHVITAGPVNIDRATDLGSSFQAAENLFTMDQGNSNLEAFLENLPDRVEYAMDVTINPLGNISNGHDFLYYDSQVTAEMDVDLPLRLIATDLTLTKDVPVDLPGSAEGHALQSGVLHLFVDNGFPFSAALSLAITDGNGQVLALLPPGGTVASGTLGPDGLISGMVASQLHVVLSEEQTDLLYQGKHLRITAAFNTADQDQHVTILDSYRMDLQVTMDANYVVNGDD
jgi:hypothetical protein